MTFKTKRYYNEEPAKLKELYQPFIEFIKHTYGNKPFPAYKASNEFFHHCIKTYKEGEEIPQLNYFKNITYMLNVCDINKVLFKFERKDKRAKLYTILE